jgi:hypothetical protein
MKDNKTEQKSNGGQSSGANCYKFLSKLKMKTADYDYLINDYIPQQGEKDMEMFITLGFSDYNYILWKLFDTGHMKKSFIEPFKKRINKVFSISL